MEAEARDGHKTGSDLGGLWLDTSDQTPSETVAELLTRASEWLVKRDADAATDPPGPYQ